MKQPLQSFISNCNAKGAIWQRYAPKDGSSIY